MQARKNLGVYGKSQSEIAVIGEQDVSFSLLDGSNVEYQGAIMGDVPALNVSDEYIVMWDEAEYRCTAYESAGNVFIGDTSLFDGSNSGDEPFVMQFFAGQGIMIYTLEDGSTHKVGLTKIGETITPIPSEYLPGSLHFHVNVTYNADTSSYISDRTYAEIEEAEAQKKAIVGTFTNENGEVYTLIGCDVVASKRCYLVAFNVSRIPYLYFYQIVVKEDGQVTVRTYGIAATEETE